MRMREQNLLPSTRNSERPPRRVVEATLYRSPLRYHLRFRPLTVAAAMTPPRTLV
ncbi:hypothetical protein IF2G_09518 [Cordyceps javanica]|nr:hypothetical protein IF2G_09518 [Cordyceps javanica]